MHARDELPVPISSAEVEYIGGHIKYNYVFFSVVGKGAENGKPR
jgi:hypothetical protein